MLPLNANVGVIGLIFIEGYIHSVVKNFSMGKVTPVSFLMRRVTKKYAFDGFGVQFVMVRV